MSWADFLYFRQLVKYIEHANKAKKKKMRLHKISNYYFLAIPWLLLLIRNQFTILILRIFNYLTTVLVNKTCNLSLCACSLIDQATKCIKVRERLR